MPHWITALFTPLTNIITKRQDRKLAAQSAKNKLMQSKADDHQAIELNKDEWEQLQVSGMDTTWKDEYVTVSVVSIFNIIVVGGLLSAVGYPQVLTGIATSITALSAAGVDVGFLLEAAVLAGLGLSVWKRT
jgi:hypothetical protein